MERDAPHFVHLTNRPDKPGPIDVNLYSKLFLHCLSRNEPIKKLCLRHGLEIHNVDGDAEVEIELPPPSLFTLGKEVSLAQRNLFTLMLGQALHS